MGDAPIRWAILGTGSIAAAMARTLNDMADARLVAVGSRSSRSAGRFGAEHGVARRHASYRAALEEDVDAVYVATPHHLHHDLTLAALQAGKAVLCEKPLAVNAAQASAMAEAAASGGRFLMEAMWMRFLPFAARLAALVEGGAIGEPLTVQADLGFRAPYEPAGRLFDPHLAGGALLDVGIYPLNLAVMTLGMPATVAAGAVLGPTGVDHQVGVVMGHGGQRLSVLTASLVADTPCEAHVTGTGGRLRIAPVFHTSERIDLEVDGKVTAVYECPIEGSGYRYEVEEVHRCLRAGLTESPTMTLADSIAIAGLLDRIRLLIGVSYPADG